MRIELENDLVITSGTDDRSFILSEKKGFREDNGKERLKPYGYYSTLSGLVEGFLRVGVCRSTAITLKQLKTDQETASRRIISLLEGLQ